MLTRTDICNFQCHEKFSVDFDPHVTTFLGASDRGKSAILRALRWVCTNKPGGDSFVREGARGCLVAIEMDGERVSRQKTPSLNRYARNEQGFSSFGADVPEPIADFLNLGPVNFQGQHDAPFWLSDTAGQVSRNLNEIVNLEIIDQALSSVARTVTKAKARAEVVGEQVEQLKEKKRSLVWVKQAKADLKLVVKIQQETAEKEAEAASLGRLYDEGVRNGQTKDRLRGAVSAFSGVLEEGRICWDLGEDVSHLGRLIEEGRRFEQIKAPDVSKLEEAMAAYNEVERQKNRLGKMMADLALRGNHKRAKVDEARTVQRELEEKLDGTCPLCGAEMGD